MKEVEETHLPRVVLHFYLYMILMVLSIYHSPPSELHTSLRWRW